MLRQKGHWQLPIRSDYVGGLVQMLEDAAPKLGRTDGRETAISLLPLTLGSTGRQSKIFSSGL